MYILNKLIRKIKLYNIKRKINKKTPKDFRDLKKKYNFDSSCKIGSNSSYGSVYILDKNRVGKVLYFYDFRELRREYISQKIAYNLGISVPQPYELVLAKNKKEGKREPMLVMEYCGKNRLRDMKDIDKYRGEFLEEERRVRKMGFKPKRGYFLDTGTHNAFWNDLEKKVVLFDCGFWDI